MAQVEEVAVGDGRWKKQVEAVREMVMMVEVEVEARGTNGGGRDEKWRLWP